jgi:hypothetical protein
MKYLIYPILKGKSNEILLPGPDQVYFSLMFSYLIFLKFPLAEFEAADPGIVTIHRSFRAF